jgi:predicted  nucleic acid-binding Zn-ribbon protein
MSQLPLLIELQSVHDNLRTIHRDLTAYPPDLAALDSELKVLAKKLEDTGKALETARAQRVELEQGLRAAQKLEDHSKAALKETKQKVQYTAAIRELDERQRQKAAVAKPLRETEARLLALETVQAEMEARRGVAQAQFDELRAIFLSEHENQVEAQRHLQSRREELQSALDPAALTRFDRLIQQRQGRAVVTVDGGNCGGCRTRLRSPLLAQLRAEKTVVCESCQRIVYDPAQRP